MIQKEAAVEVLRGMSERHKSIYGTIDPKCYMAEEAIDYALMLLEQPPDYPQALRSEVYGYLHNGYNDMAKKSDMRNGVMNIFDKYKPAT